MKQADHVVLLGSAQFTPKNKPVGYTEGKKTGQQHALIGSPNGAAWLTVPVGSKRQTIKNTKLAEGEWRDKFLATLKHNYAKAPFFTDMINKVVEMITTDSLHDLNMASTIASAQLIDCDSKITRDTDYNTSSTKGDWMLDLCKETNCDTYICGAPSLDYLDLDQWRSEGITVVAQEWACPTYSQVWKQFQPNLSWWDAYAHLGDGVADLFN